MADEDMADQYYDDEDDFEWMYVEDTCPLEVSPASASSARCRFPCLGA
jgi:hypothetical protein